MGIRTKAFVAATALACAGLVGAQTPAAAATAPYIRMTQPVFTSLTGDGANSTFPFAWDASFTMKWSVYAPAGACHQYYTDQGYSDEGGPTDPILGGNTYTLPIANSARSYSNTDGYWLDWGRGGYNAVDRITQCNGTKITSNPVHTVIQVGNDQNTNNGETVPTYFSPNPGLHPEWWTRGQAACAV